MCVHIPYTYRSSWGSEEVVRSPETGFVDGCKQPDVATKLRSSARTANALDHGAIFLAIVF